LGLLITWNSAATKRRIPIGLVTMMRLETFSGTAVLGCGFQYSSARMNGVMRTEVTIAGLGEAHGQYIRQRYFDPGGRPKEGRELLRPGARLRDYGENLQHDQPARQEHQLVYRAGAGSWTRAGSYRGEREES